MAKPQNKVKIEWSPNFAYAIGLLTTDGNLSKDERHINFTSKDYELIKKFKKCLGLQNKIYKKSRDKEKVKRYYFVQFGDVNFYKFLLNIGLTPAKSKTLGELNILNKYFFDFLRGCFDGDGCFYSYWDKRWSSSFMFYTVFSSASKKHLDWLRDKMYKRLGVKGCISKSPKKSTLQLKYAKKESLKILNEIYQSKKYFYLSRKKLKIDKALAIIGKRIT